MNPFDKVKTNQAKAFIEDATGETSENKEYKKVGRPKGSGISNKKDCLISVYVTQDDKIKLKELAHKYRMTISQYLIFKAFYSES
ncbi:hypothetical protein [Helicobacter turcicus]|uniref:CopG family transcriptional regulator n=1 Tax=Helicobacter turcicus TaxID=2867412 RepID=A0ABS7JPC1_9HELI|nr:hypothetical protein [Helicobacter turcicus]MBX7491209.1 hypothetical protein [Helicobacter turcicus]MBX7546152.1 hypothetical protein [Helicobacter turcicus]